MDVDVNWCYQHRTTLPECEARHTLPREINEWKEGYAAGRRDAQKDGA